MCQGIAGRAHSPPGGLADTQRLQITAALARFGERRWEGVSGLLEEYQSNLEEGRLQSGINNNTAAGAPPRTVSAVGSRAPHFLRRPRSSEALCTLDLGTSDPCACLPAHTQSGQSLYPGLRLNNMPQALGVIG